MRRRQNMQAEYRCLGSFKTLHCSDLLVKHLLRFEYGLLRRLKDRIKATDDAHRQDDIGILAALEQVAENIVSDSPDEGDNSVVRSLIHQVAILRNVWLLENELPTGLRRRSPYAQIHHGTK